VKTEALSVKKLEKHKPIMKFTATTLYPFVSSGKQFARALEFFVALGFSLLVAAGFTPARTRKGCDYIR